MQSDVQAFVREARAFFYVRRTKQRKPNRARTAFCTNQHGYWTRIGAGHYAEAWVHEAYPELVLKISGPSGWGEDYPQACNSGSSYDIWPAYAQACMQNPHEHLPKVHHLERHGGLSWGVMPRYNAAPGTSRHAAIVTRFKRAMLQEIRADYWMLPILNITLLENCTLDMHDGNIMQDPDTGNLVITDPFSTIMSKPSGVGLQEDRWVSYEYPDTEEYNEFTNTDVTIDEEDQTC